MSTWILIDVSNLAYRSFHAMGGLSYEGEATGALYGLFRDIINLQERFSTPYIAFCFDGGYDHRTRLFPGYKRSRHIDEPGISDEAKQARQGLRRQLHNLRVKYLPEAGFCNICYQESYEADDVIASICVNESNKKRRFIINSSDNDLYQLLSPTVSIWCPSRKKLLTDEWFRDEYKVSPAQWADVKALTGCSTDDIPGIQGVGPVRACKFLAGTLKNTTVAYESIVACPEVWERNIKLTRLPMEGTKRFPLVYDDVSDENWDKVMESLGMRSLMKSSHVAGKVKHANTRSGPRH